MAELKYESLQQHCSGLEREVGEMRVELRATRKRLKGAEKEVESREGEGSSQEAELQALRKQVQQLYDCKRALSFSPRDTTSNVCLLYVAGAHAAAVNEGS